MTDLVAALGPTRRLALLWTTLRRPALLRCPLRAALLRPGSLLIGLIAVARPMRTLARCLALELPLLGCSALVRCLPAAWALRGLAVLGRELTLLLTLLAGPLLPALLASGVAVT